jgi:hypothetical protein
VQRTVGILRHFRAFSTPKRNPALGVLSKPAPPPLTQTVRQPVAKIKESLNHKFGFMVEFGKANSFLVAAFFRKSFALFHCAESGFQLAVG